MADRAFLVLGGVFGLLLVLVSPPFRWGDENSHLLQAYALSEGALQREVVAGRHGARLPRGLHELIGYFVKRQRVSPGRVVPWSDALAARDIDLAAESRMFLTIVRMPYSPLSHAPQALGIALARPLTTSVLALFVAARLANLLAWLGLVWIALRVAPDFRWPLCIAALSPMGMFLAASCAPDALANGLAFLWSAAILRLAAGPRSRIGAATLVALAALAVALSLAKLVYGPLIALLVLIPRERFAGGRRRLAVTAVLGLLGVVAVVAWLAWAGEGGTQRLAVEGPAASQANLRYAVADPLGLLGLLARTSAGQGAHWIRQLADTHWGQPLAPRSTVWIWLAAVGLALVADPPRAVALSLGRRLVLLGIVATTFAAIVGVAFVLWSPAGDAEARGVQGRYLIPLLPALLLAVAPLALPLADRTRRALAAAAAVLAAIALLQTSLRGMSLLALL